MSDSEPGLFDEPARIEVPDPFAGMGRDARRTARQRESLAGGVHPGTRLPLHHAAAPFDDRAAEGARCKGCARLYRTGAGNKDFLKCEAAGTHNSRGSWGPPDIRAWWPACRLYEPKE